MNPIETVARRSLKEGSCLLWQGPKNHKGYGQMRFKGKSTSVHRVVYEAAHGPIPDGLEIDHLCRVRHCAAIEHLEAVTHAENIRRASVARTHCKHGHEYTPENTRYQQLPTGPSRLCRTCVRRNRKAGKIRRRAREEQLAATAPRFYVNADDGYRWLTCGTCEASLIEIEGGVQLDQLTDAAVDHRCTDTPAT